MKADSEIRRDVENELQWNPDIDATDVGVSVRDGVVSLSGFVRSYSQKWQAEVDAKRVMGVRGVANDIEVRLPTASSRSDPEIARDAVDTIKHELPYSAEGIRVVAKAGWIMLEGEAEWEFQRSRAEAAVRRIRGVKGVSNLIMLKPSTAPTDVKQKIVEAFRRHAEIDANLVTVEANGHEVILRGTVRSWAEREEAERTAWRAPGVTKVDNRITIAI